MKKTTNTILVLLLLAVQSLAQQSQVSNPVFTVAATPGQPIPDSISVSYFKGIINGNSNREVISVNKKNSDGNFVFSFSGKQPISPFAMLVYYGKRAQNSKIYYAEPADQIKMSVSKGSQPEYAKGDTLPILSFSGKGFEKYKVADILHQKKNAAYMKFISYLRKLRADMPKRTETDKTEYAVADSPNVQNYLTMLYNEITNDLSENQDTIAMYKAQLGDNVANFYNYEFSPYRYFGMGTSELYLDKQYNKFKQWIADYYFSKITFIRPDPQDSWFKYGIYYRQNRSNDLLFEAAYQTNGKGFPLSVQYDKIKAVKNTELRDILITKFFEEERLRNFTTNKENRDSCLEDALKIVTHAELKASLTNQLLLSTGSKVYDFTFYDVNGKTVTLNDLKGKVFMLDFYYYGCGPCAYFADKFDKEVYPEFSNDPDFRVLSVNTDKTKAIWEKAKESGLYSIKNALHLYTGMAFNHPIFKYYNVNSLPFILLVGKDGKLISQFSGPQPEMTALIRNALKK